VTKIQAMGDLSEEEASLMTHWTTAEEVEVQAGPLEVLRQRTLAAQPNAGPREACMDQWVEEGDALEVEPEVARGKREQPTVKGHPEGVGQASAGKEAALAEGPEGPQRAGLYDRHPFVLS
jgi:hypothetical protein